MGIFFSNVAVTLATPWRAPSQERRREGHRGPPADNCESNVNMNTTLLYIMDDCVLYTILKHVRTIRQDLQ